MSGRIGTVEQLSIIRSALDATGYTSGAQAIQRANEAIERSQQQVASGSQTTTRAIQQSERAMVQLARQTDPVAKAMLAYAKAQEDVNAAVSRGVITQEQANRQLAVMSARVELAVREQQRLAAATTQTANAFGVTQRQAQALMPQINDLVTGALSGQSAFMLLTQQGGQITQAMGGVGNTFRALVGLITPARAAIVGVTAAVTASIFAYETHERRVIALGRSLRATQSDYASFARELDRGSRAQSLTLPGATLGETRDIRNRLGGLFPTDMRDQIPRITETIVDMGRALGDLDRALDDTTRAFQDPERAARDFMQRGFRGFDEDFRRHIELLVQGNERLRAFTEIMERLRGTFQGAQRQVSDVEQAWQNLRKGWEGFTGSIAERLQGAGGGLIRFFGDSVAGAGRAQQAFSTFGTAVVTALNPIVGVQALIIQHFERIAQVAPQALTLLSAAARAALGDTSALSQWILNVGRGGAAATPGTTAAPTAPRGFSPIASTDLPPEARAFLDTIAGPESGGRYDVRWGGMRGPQTITDLSRHPNILEPGPAGPSSAAGRYQITGSNWYGAGGRPGLAARYGATDFSPQTQDRVTWAWAQDEYRRQTGRDLLSDLRDPSRHGSVAGALGGTSMWSTLNMGRFPGHLAAHGGPSPVASSGPSPTAPPAATTSPASVSSQQRADQDLIGSTRGTRADREEEIRVRIDALEAARNRITERASSEGRDLTAQEERNVRQLTDAIQEQLAERARLEDSTARGIRLGQQQNRVLAEEDQVRRRVNEEIDQQNEQRRQAGQPPMSRAEELATEANIRQRLRLERQDSIRDTEELIQAETRLAQAYLLGARSAVEAEARNRALQEARQTETVGTEAWRALVERLTQQYVRLGQARAEASLGPQILAGQRELDLLRAEVDAVGANTEARQRNLAVRRETARLEGISPGLSDTELGRRALSQTEERVELELRRNRLNQMEGYGREAGSILGKHITDAIRTGSTRGFKEVPGMLWDVLARGLITRPFEEFFANMTRNMFNTGGAFSGSGGGGIVGGIASLFGGGAGAAKAVSEVSWAAIAHEGGVPGRTGAWRAVDPTIFREAPRYHSGLGPGIFTAPHELATILTKDEVVLNARQQRSVAGALSGGRSTTIIQNIQTPDAGSFMRSQAQIAVRTRGAFGRSLRSS